MSIQHVHTGNKKPLAYAVCFGLFLLFVPLIVFAFTEAIGQAILSMFGVLTGVGGWFLNYAIERLVIQMGSTLQSNGVDISISTIWTVIRDVCNIAFVFGLIFVGFQTILNIETINTKKTLVAIVVGALLINFSLFFTQIVIDVSNLFAVEVYELMESEEEAWYGIAGSFMQAMGMNTFLTGSGFGDLTTYNVTAGGNVSFFFMAMIFLLIAAFVFLAGAVLLVIRFVALILIMIFSPVIFAGMVFPQTQAAAKGLLSKLLGYSFFAPLYLFMLYVSLTVLDQTRGAFPGSFSDAFANAKVGAFPIILNFTIGAVLLIASLIIAKNLSVAGADKTIGYGRGLGRGLAGRAGSFAGRHTLGRAAEGLQKKYDQKDAQKNNGWAFTALNIVGGRSFRNTLEATKGAKFGGAYSRKDDIDYNKEVDKRRSGETRKQLVKDAVKILETSSDPAERERAQKEIQDATVKELEEIKDTLVKNNVTARFLSKKQIEALEKSEELTELEKRNIKDNRTNGIGQEINDRGADNYFASLKDNQFSELPSRIIVDNTTVVARTISGNAARKVLDQDVLTKSQREDIVTSHQQQGRQNASFDNFLNTPQGQFFA